MDFVLVCCSGHHCAPRWIYNANRWTGFYQAVISIIMNFKCSRKKRSWTKWNRWLNGAATSVQFNSDSVCGQWPSKRFPLLLSLYLSRSLSHSWNSASFPFRLVDKMFHFDFKLVQIFYQFCIEICESAASRIKIYRKMEWTAQVFHCAGEMWLRSILCKAFRFAGGIATSKNWTYIYIVIGCWFAWLRFYIPYFYPILERIELNEHERIT